MGIVIGFILILIFYKTLFKVSFGLTKLILGLIGLYIVFKLFAVLGLWILLVPLVLISLVVMFFFDILGRLF